MKYTVLQLWPVEGVNSFFFFTARYYLKASLLSVTLDDYLESDLRSGKWKYK